MKGIIAAEYRAAAVHHWRKAEEARALAEERGRVLERIRTVLWRGTDPARAVEAIRRALEGVR